MAGFCQGTVKESTYTRYYRNVYSYLVPALSKHLVSRLDSTIINQLKEELLLRGGKRATDCQAVSTFFGSKTDSVVYAAGDTP